MTTVDVGAGLASFLPQLGFRPIRLRLRLRRWLLAGGGMGRIDWSELEVGLVIVRRASIRFDPLRYPRDQLLSLVGTNPSLNA